MKLLEIFKNFYKKYFLFFISNDITSALYKLLYDKNEEWNQFHIILFCVFNVPDDNGLTKQKIILA